MSRLARRLRRPEGEAGITLVELLVYSVLSVVVITVVGSLLLRTLTSQRDVRSVAEATTTAQLVAASVEAGVRNAAAISHTLSGTDELLVVRTQTGPAGAPTWTCRAWFYDAGSLTFSTRSVPASTATSPAIVAPTASGDHAAWTLLAEGVNPGSTGPTVFVPSTGVPVTRVGLNVLVGAGTRKPVEISTRVTARPQGSAESSPCF